MLEIDGKVGGERSGHIILREFANTGDGLLTALFTAGILSQSGKPFSEMAKMMTIFPQTRINLTVENQKKDMVLANEDVKKEIARQEAILGADGRVLVRKSGTEPLVRVMVEAGDVELCDRCARAIADAIERAAR